MGTDSNLTPEKIFRRRHGREADEYAVRKATKLEAAEAEIDRELSLLVSDRIEGPGKPHGLTILFEDSARVEPPRPKRVVGEIE